MRKVLLTLTVLLLAACGGGGGDEPNVVDIPNVGAVLLTLNKDGIIVTHSYQQTSNYKQLARSGYFSPTTLLAEWTGNNMSYTAGYLMPTSGTLKSFKILKPTGELYYSITNINYDISKTAATVVFDALPLAALADAVETKIVGGINDDISLVFTNTSEIDLAGGNDTLRLSSNFSGYQFSRVSGSNTQINISSNSHTVLIKNVESFQFADSTKTISEY
jgi:hypothetical protein